jgi:hypothetical protein
MNPFQRAATCVLFVSAAAATPALAQGRAWLDVNVGVAAAGEDVYTDAAATPQIANGLASAEYQLPRDTSFDIGGGFMFHPRVGAGVSVVRARHEGPVALHLRLPDPDFPAFNAEDDAMTDIDLQRSETAINLQVMATVTPALAPLAVRVFGGPTYFRVRQDTVTDLFYVDGFTPQDVYFIEIVEYEFVEGDADDARSNGWGFHVGADVSFFFSEFVGVGGVFRYTRGELDALGMFNQQTQIKVGGVQAGGGLRLRF